MQGGRVENSCWYGGRQVDSAVAYLGRVYTEWIYEITVFSNLIISCSNDKTAKVWDTQSLNLIATLEHNCEVFCAAVDDTKIVTGVRMATFTSIAIRHDFRSTLCYN